VTYGHSLVVDPWGKVLLDMGGESPGLGFADLDLGAVEEVRARLPAIWHRRPIPPPERTTS
jgi:predicted amidohydrolase